MAVELAQNADQIAGVLQSMLGDYAPVALQILKIIGINIVLSGDNAVVIALACRALPPRQRMMGIILGAGAAVILRIIFTVAIQYLLDVPYLKVVGGLLLLWIAVKLVNSGEADEESVAAGNSLFEAVKIVAIADIVMSLDNVLAIAAAAGSNTWLVILGLVISIPLVVAGATLIMALLSRFPILVWAGAALLGWVAGELIVEEKFLTPYFDQFGQMLLMSHKLTHYAVSAIGALLVVAVGWLLSRKSEEEEQVTTH